MHNWQNKNATIIFDQGNTWDEMGKIIQYRLMPEGKWHRTVHEMGGISGRPSIFVSILESELQQVLLYESDPSNNSTKYRTYFKPISIPTKTWNTSQDRTIYISKELLEAIQAEQKQ